MRATLKLIEARRFARTHRFVYPDVVPMLAHLRRLTASNTYDYLRGNALPAPQQPSASSDAANQPAIGPPAPFSFFLEATVFYDDVHELIDQPVTSFQSTGAEVQIEDWTYFEFTDQVVQLAAQLETAGLGQLPHPWLDLFVPDSAIDAFAVEAIAQLDLAHFLPGSVLLFYPFVKANLTCPLLRTPDEDQFVLFDILRTIPPDEAIIQQVLTQNRQFYERNRDGRGFPYTISALPMDSLDWVDYYGNHWTPVKHLKGQYDPKHVLGTGLSIFDNRTTPASS